MAHPFIPVPNTCLIEAFYTWGGQQIENTFHVKKGSPFTALELQALINTFDAWDSTGATRWQLSRKAECILTGWKARALDTAASPIFVYTLPTPRPGAAGSGGALPGNCTFCLQWQTGLAGRSQRGRLYLPGLSTGDLQAAPNQSLVSSGRASVYVASLNALIAAINALTGYSLVVVSYRHLNAWRTEGQTSTILNATYADLSVDSQRRRLVGRGR